MIISASRRTDIPAFYAEWFMNRIRAGYCTVPNPFNRNQVSAVSLRPEDVEVIVFWTRNPRPLFPHLEELTGRGYRYYFQYTLLNNPRLIDPKSPPYESAAKTLCDLAALVGPERVIWRYDPIVLSNITGAAFHQANYALIAGLVAGHTRRSVVSIMDWYRKIDGRLRGIARQGAEVPPGPPTSQPEFGDLMRHLAAVARSHGMEIVSCAEDLALDVYGIRPGKCVDDEYIKSTFGIDVSGKKDPTQREACGCVVSRDIGMYDSCLFGCQYCYATGSFERAHQNHAEHDPRSPSLLGHFEARPVEPGASKQPTPRPDSDDSSRLKLF